MAIPADVTERIIPAPRIQSAVYETENSEAAPPEESQSAQAFVSLPALFQMEIEAPHGLILKSACAVKTMLLTPRIEKDIEIPDESIHQLPDVFTGGEPRPNFRFRDIAGGSGVYQYFSGAYVDGQTITLILDTQKFLQDIKND